MLIFNCRRRTSCRVLAGLLLTSFLFFISEGHTYAGTITNSAAIVGPGLGSVSNPVVVITTTPGNDDEPGQTSNNIAIPLKVFDSNGFIDIEFIVVPNGIGPGGTDVTEYLFYESVDNNTGSVWGGYQMILGTNFGDNFIPSPPDDGLDFDFPDYTMPPSSEAFATVTADAGGNELTFSNGSQSSGAKNYQVRIDVPNSVSTFTLRQLPIPVPEPGTLLLGLIALAPATCFLGRRRRTA